MLSAYSVLHAEGGMGERSLNKVAQTLATELMSQGPDEWADQA